MITIDPESRPLVARSETGAEWVVSRLHSVEAMDDLYQHRAVILSRALDEVSLLGQGITFCYQPVIASSRVKNKYFHGYCVQVLQVGMMESRGYLQYEIIVAPWCWFLQQRSNCRVFQQKKTGEIIKDICREHGFQGDLSLKINNDESREYTVQYNESDWAFISRLIAARGWFYFFNQKNDGHELIIGETNRIFADCGESEIEYLAGSSKLQRAITQWSHEYQMMPGSVVSADFNVEMAQPVMTDESSSPQKQSHRDRLQQYFYPGGFQDRDQGSKVTGDVLASLDAQISQIQGRSSLTGFAAGTHFQLDHHPYSKEQQKYLLSRVEHILSTTEDGRSMEYGNRFECLPLKNQWKSLWINHGQNKNPLAKPVMPGLQSATVTGPEGEEVYLDQYHRIKLQFHWDREREKDQNSSCWVRVAQPLAGDGFGCQFTPRVGDEVLVSFLDNNPDQPLVVGTVYNGRHQQPYSNTSVQGLKLKSFPKAGADNFNELRFDCKKDEELLYFRAERDMHTLVKNDTDLVVKGKSTALVEKTSERTVKEDDSHKIEGEQKTEVSKNISTKTDADYQLQTSGAFDQKTSGDYKLDVKGSTSAKSTGDISINSQSNIDQKATANLTMDATSIKGTGKSGIELSVGASKINLSNSAIEICCGPSSVKLSSSGVEISGMQVKVEGQVMAEVKGGVSASLEGTVNTEVKGTMVTINGNAMTSIKAGALVELSGAIAKIN